MKERYWHIQMFLPEGKGGTKINSSLMLEEKKAIVGTGEWNDIQCQYFKGEQGGLKIGDVIMVREGSRPLALCKITSDYFHSDELTDRYLNYWFRHVEVLDWANKNEWNPLFSQGTLKILYKTSDTPSWNYINDWYKKVLLKMKEKEIRKLTELLLFKHQIILQGAPGTGKTYNAKLIAEELVKEQTSLKNKPNIITDSDIKKYLKTGEFLNSISGRKEYKIESISANKVEVSGGDTTSNKPISFSSIIEGYSNKKWETGKSVKGFDPYISALALHIYNKTENVFEPKDKEKYIKLVQFHPSYSYEDFVRGIVVNTSNGIPEYINQNKILGEFAKEAWENWNLFKLTQENKVDKILAEKSKTEQFVNSVQQKIDEDGKYQLTANVYLFEYDDTRFKYKGDNWEAHASGLNMKYSELRKVFESGFTERSDIKSLMNIESLTNSHATYYAKMAEKYSTFQPTKKQENIQVTKPNNYILIIDEINRANLPAVLGELIYTLEYRGEKVRSMYAIDGDNGLILPPNLYIIGTMNTADRSVGQIDYAIRRRFAFVDMLPTILDVEGFQEDLFEAVSILFVENVKDYLNDNTVSLVPSIHLSSEFRPEDVWLGHSYFIMKENRELRLKYEIIPILKEYMKDGILKESAKEIIEKLR